jgi:hypothetical protein
VAKAAIVVFWVQWPCKWLPAFYWNVCRVLLLFFFLQTFSP